MYARAAELAEVLDSVRRGTNVVVRGLPGAGRSELLRRAAADLEATGIQAVTANGLYWDRARQRRAATQPANTDADVVSFATSLAQELQGSVVLLVDDADELDDATMLLVDTLASRLRAPMIMAVPPLPRDARSALPRASRHAVTVDVRPLLYPETTDYLRAHRGIHADARLATRIYTKSGGVPGLVDALVDTGTRSGLIAERDGTWSMTGTSLWNRHLEPFVMRLVGSLSAEEHDALEALALAGALPLGPALELVGPALVTSLSERELLTVLGDTRSGALISVTPPLVADHVRRSTISPARLVLEDRVRAVLGDEASGADDPAGQGVASLGTPADAALGRYFADREASDQRVRWRLWDDAPSVPAALRYLAVAMTASGPPQGVDELLVRTPVTDADSAADVLALAAYAVLHRDLHHGDASAVLGVLDEVSRRFPQLSEALVWQQRLSDMLRGGVELAASAEGEAPTESIGRNAVAAVRGLTDALGGRGADASARLAEMTGRPSPIIAYVESMTHGLALLAEGRGDELADTALRSLDAARVVLDRSALFLHSYLATVALIRVGRWREARQILGGVLVLGSPPRFLAHSWAGMCRLSALLSLRSGDPAFSRSLLAGADAAVGSDGALPGAQRRLSDAIRALAEGDDAGAADEMREGAQECRGRGWFLAAVSLQTYAVCLDPTDRNVRELQTLRDHPVGRSTTQFVDFVVAARSSAEAAADAAAAYVPDASTFFVILVLRTLTEHAEAASSTDARVLADAASALTERAGWERPAEYFDGRHALMVELTPREREIGLLAGVHSNGEIAELLHLSTRTVANHVSNALRKLGLSSRAELFEWLRSEAARAG
jgi:DNA-binding NarL/FixJ family response regulator